MLEQRHCAKENWTTQTAQGRESIPEVGVEQRPGGGEDGPRKSEASVGQSARLKTVRSVAQACMGPLVWRLEIRNTMSMRMRYGKCKRRGENDHVQTKRLRGRLCRKHRDGGMRKATAKS